ncbi:adenylate isopentenyltransferase 5, chloroplastic-like [Solanum pennellii]|uniref:Adenylate isopentenyltransferase 5, chloroplastic-like n=1 Tax=Solanum pennellii TaxID=28526 RepID=A0ABM1FJ76_SOLPN|nr:adenylate isopentenyltransferase 5, chloroplastic-like [Solanum pennellii]
MGATGMRKFRLSVDLATHFRGEIINSDKMQVYKGLEIVTNKITHTEKQDSDFTAEDCCLKAVIYIEKILKTQRVPIIVGWSNSYIEELVEDPVFMLVDEVRQIFIPDADYSKGIRRYIGVPEMDRYLREETNIDGDDESKKMILQASISSIKRNTREIEPDSDFTAEDFRLQVVVYTEKIMKTQRVPIIVGGSNSYIEELVEDPKKILKTQRVPIIVGGSNSYIEKLVEDPVLMFKYKYDSGFIWIDVEQSVLNLRVDMRVDQTVKAGPVDEVRQIFIPDADYTKEIRRSIGVPEWTDI